MKKPDTKSKGLKTVEEISFEDTGSIISEPELMRQLNEKKGYTLYLGVFTKDEVLKILERSHIWHELMLKGFVSPLLDINTDDPHRHILRVYFDRIDKAHMLMEIVLSDSIFKPRIKYLPSFNYGTYNVLVIEWLVLQNPLAQFGPEKPQLPDQQYPGLGIARLVSDMLIKVASHLKKDGILNFPQYYHNAVIYSEIFKFYSPYMHGTLKALEASLSRYSLAHASHAVSLGCVKNLRDGDYFKWKTEELILPLSLDLKQYFASREYENILRNTMKEYSFDIDTALYEYRATHRPPLP
ncbi:MAG: hypothetical protein M1517_08800 [Deltaproteobacteria bacterium]|nr:hypothetical protein [Deltaproteobacteria bacterium]